MNFRPRYNEEPMEINLIPLIDVLLVILVFLAASTSFTQQRQLQLDLPQAQQELTDTQDKNIQLAIDQQDLYSLDNNFIDINNQQDLAQAIIQAKNSKEQVSLTIAADKKASHGAVVLALEAARIANIEKINFLTETSQ